jgi:glucose/arabinose dehydrogenase
VPEERLVYPAVIDGSFGALALNAVAQQRDADGESGMALAEGRRPELDLAGGQSRVFAAGLRNPVGLAWEPHTGMLWTVVNERDGLGDETPPDYLTSVRDGGFYGWPYCYWGQTVDDRCRKIPSQSQKPSRRTTRWAGTPRRSVFAGCSPARFRAFPEGMAIGQHGSWNRSTLSGYKVVFVPFANGRPAGPPRDILSGFLAADGRVSYGRRSNP